MDKYVIELNGANVRLYKNRSKAFEKAAAYYEADPDCVIRIWHIRNNRHAECIFSNVD